MNTTDYENIWKASLIHVTDEFALPPVVLQVDEAIIGTLGNFSVSTGKAKAKKTFNVSAIVAAALVNGQVLEYQASFPESKRTILYFDTEQSPYHCQLVMQRILKLAKLPIDREPEHLKFSHLRAIADPNERREIIRYAIYHTPNGYCPIKVCKLQSSYICGEFKNQIKNNEAYNGTKIGNYFRNGLE